MAFFNKQKTLAIQLRGGVLVVRHDMPEGVPLIEGRRYLFLAANDVIIEAPWYPVAKFYLTKKIINKN